MKISVVIPVFNEKATIREICSRIRAVDIDKEVILVDDGSTDGTAEVLAELVDGRTHLYGHARNMGKGAALRTGFSHASGDVIIVQDADLEYAPEQYGKLIQPILDGRADVVYGSRFVTGDFRRVIFFWHMVGNRFLTLLSNMFTNLNLSDMETGCKIFKRDILQQMEIEEDRFGFEPEFTAKISKLNLRIYEIGISYAGRTYQEGKKVGWRDGFSAVRCILKYNLMR
ncbi:MAG: glycosyltransferase family 2 protein [Verrucomicrobia bacterium]|nr:glycosyltransferase family 2 protein [Deltaproteobacteria bacterium]